MNDILIVCGECYCGKGMFISKLEKIFSNCYVIHIGDIIRKESEKLNFNFNKDLAISGKIIAEIIEKQILSVVGSNKLIIVDNPMKNVDQAENILGLFEDFNMLESVKVLWVTNARTNNDYTKRGRIDDNMIPKKLEDWKKNGSKFRKYIEKKNIPIFDIKNTDDGFLLM